MINRVFLVPVIAINNLGVLEANGPILCALRHHNVDVATRSLHHVFTDSAQSSSALVPLPWKGERPSYVSLYEFFSLLYEIGVVKIRSERWDNNRPLQQFL